MSLPNAIFCLSYGIDVFAAQRFIRSLEQCQFDGKLVLFLDQTGTDAIKPTVANSPLTIDIIDAAPALDCLPNALNKRRISLWKRLRGYQKLPLPNGLHWRMRHFFAQIFLAPHCYRYFRFQEYLRQHPNQFDKILHCDIRDVVIQSDPFADVATDDLLIAMESQYHSISHSELNSNWIDAAFGPEILAQVSDSPVSCSGTTIGGAGPMTRYFELMTLSLSQANSRVWLGPGIDQGVHNMLLHTGKLEPTQRRNNGDGPYLTLDGVNPALWPLGDDGYIRDPKGRVIPIVHQFDRYSELEQAINSAMGMRPDTEVH